MKTILRQLFISGLELRAWYLDKIGARHNIRRRLGQLRRRVGAGAVTSNGVPASLSVLESVADQKSGGAA